MTKCVDHLVRKLKPGIRDGNHTRIPDEGNRRGRLLRNHHLVTMIGNLYINYPASPRSASNHLYCLLSSLIDQNLTKAKPLPLPVALSLGMKESTIFPALKNIASSSVEEIASWRFETNRNTDFSFKVMILLGMGFTSPAILWIPECRWYWWALFLLTYGKKKKKRSDISASLMHFHIVPKAVELLQHILSNYKLGYIHTHT